MALDKMRSVDLRIDKANDYLVTKLLSKQGDYNGRELIVQITNGGVVENQITTQMNLGWRHLKYGNSGLDPFKLIDADKGLFGISYSEEMLRTGDVLCTVQIIQGGKLTETRNFNLEVEESPINKKLMVTQDSFKALEKALTQVNEWDGKFESKYAGLEEEYALELTTLKQETTAQFQQKTNNYADKTINTFPNHPANGNGKEIFSTVDSFGKRVAILETEQIPNGYTVFNLYPSTDKSRTKFSFWEKSLDSLTDGELPRRPLSIETHGYAEGEENHVTFYSNDGSGTPTESTAAKVFQWHWGEDWDNSIEFLAMIQGKGLFNPAEWDNDQNVHIGKHKSDAGQPIIHFGDFSNPKLASIIENRGGIFRLRAGSEAKMQFEAPEFIFNSGRVNLQKGTRIQGVLGDTASPGVYIGTQGDTNQPSIFLQNGTSDSWTVDNRLGNIRFIYKTETTPKFAFTKDGNLGIGSDSIFAGGHGVIGIKNAATVPTAPPTSGGVLYVENGSLKYRGSNNTVTTLGAA